MTTVLLCVGVLCALIQGLFWGVSWWLLRRWKSSVPAVPTSPSVTVLVCARNEAENLRKHLPLWLAQDYPDFEVLVVDDASEDESAEFLASWAARHPRLQAVRIPEKVSAGKKAALELGLRHSQREWVLLTDADCRPAGPDWIRRMMAELDPGTDVVLGYGAASTSKSGVGIWYQFETFYTGVQYLGLALAGLPYMGVGRNILYRRESALAALAGVAGRDLPGGDDDLLVNRIAKAGNTRVALHPASFTYTEAPSDWSAWLRQKSRHFSTGKYYRWQHRLLLGGLALSQAGAYLAILGLLLLGKPGWAGMLYTARLLTYWPASAWLAGRLGSEGIRGWLPLLDVCLPGYYLLFARSIFLKKTESRW
jgi:biofilm PGA synthesis N-glycosyltransferase PgaC